MPLDNDKSDLSFQEEFVPVIFARSAEDAEQYRQLLEDHGIEAIIGTEDFGAHINMDAVEIGGNCGFPVLVSEICLDEASRVIANREDMNGFDLDDEDIVEDEEDDKYSLEEENDDLEIMFDDQNLPDERQRFDDDPDDKFL